MEMPSFTNISYERPSLDSIRDCVLRTRLKMMTAHSSETIEASILEFQKEISRFETAYALCNIRHDLNTLDPFYKEEITFYEEAGAVVSDLTASVYTLLLSSTLSDELKAKFGEMIFRKARNRKETISSDIIPDLAEEAALQNEYDQILSEALCRFDNKEYPLSMMDPFLESPDRDVRRRAHLAVAVFFSENKERLDEIFSQLVELRDKMAKKLQCSSFTELGYKRMERYDYTPEMVSEFRALVVKYIVPVTTEIRRLQRERLDVDKLKYYDYPHMFVGGNPRPNIRPDELHAAASTLFQRVFEKNPSFFDVLSGHGFMDLEARKAKSTGGYCSTLLDYGIPYIFMNANGTADDVATLIHESGHAYAAIRSVDSSPFIDLLSPTLETCEIHSTAMEFLTYPHMEIFFHEQADAYRQLHMTRALLFLPYGCMVDEFQHCIYENPQMSPEERDAAWRLLENKYQPYNDYDDVEFYEIGGAWQKKGHIFTDPFYYIDYCLALICSLEIWDMTKKDPKMALRAYDHLCVEGGNGTFLELLAKAGLTSPFLPDVFKRVAYKACEYLEL